MFSKRSLIFAAAATCTANAFSHEFVQKHLLPKLAHHDIATPTIAPKPTPWAMKKCQDNNTFPFRVEIQNVITTPPYTCDHVVANVKLCSLKAILGSRRLTAQETAVPLETFRREFYKDPEEEGFYFKIVPSPSSTLFQNGSGLQSF